MPAWGDPGAWLDPVFVRTAGRALLLDLNISDVTNQVEIGWGSAKSGNLNASVLRVASDLIKVYPGGVAGPTVAIPADATAYKFAVVLRGSGAFYFIKGGAFTKWTLIWIGATNTTAALYAGISNYNAALSADNLTISPRLWLPSPVASDSFVRGNGALSVTDGLGHAEVSGPGAGGSGVAWTGNFVIATNKAVNTPTVGAELLTNAGFEGTYVGGVAPNWYKTRGTWTESADAHGGSKAQQINNPAGNSGYGYSNNIALTSGIWARFTCWAKAIAGTGFINMYAYDGNPRLTDDVPISAGVYTFKTVTGRCTSSENHVAQIYADSNASADANSILYDDASVVPLTLASLFSSLQATTPDIIVDVKLAAYTTGTQAGIVARLDSAATPANFLILYQDGANVKLDVAIAGVYTSLMSTASAFAASDTLRLDTSGANWRAYKIVAAGTATLLGSGTTLLVSGSLGGLFATDVGSQFSSMTCFSKGTSGEYEAVLNSMAA